MAHPQAGIPAAAARNVGRRMQRLREHSPEPERGSGYPSSQQLLNAIYAGQPFSTTLRDLGLTPNQVWSSAWHYSGLCAWLRPHGVSGTSAPAHGEEPQGRAVEKLLHRDWRSPVMAIERAEISLLPWFRSPHREAPPATSPVVEQGEYVRPTSGAFTCSQKALGFETLGVSCLHTVGSPGPA